MHTDRPIAVVPAPRESDGLLSSHDVAEHAGITYRQLDYWIRVGYVHTEIPARGSGTARRFTPEQADRVALLAALTHAGLALHAAAAALDRYTGGDTLVIPLTHPTPLHAVTA